MENINDVLEKARKYVSVTFCGYLADEGVIQFYQNVDVFVFPSIWEGFGIPILEAYAQGTPVVASCVSSMPEVGGDLGIYVDPCDPEDIARGLLKASKMTMNERISFSHKAKAYAANFTWEKTAEGVIKFIIDRLN
jgi:alpha-1,3-rhamnosyl/mannosyltransferase